MKTQSRITLTFDMKKPDDVQSYHEYISLHVDATYRIMQSFPDGRIMIEACFPEETV